MIGTGGMASQRRLWSHLEGDYYTKNTHHCSNSHHCSNLDLKVRLWWFATLNFGKIVISLSFFMGFKRVICQMKGYVVLYYAESIDANRFIHQKKNI